MIAASLALFLILPAEPVSLILSAEILETIKGLSDLKQQTQTQQQNLSEISQQLKNIDGRLSRIEEILSPGKATNQDQIDKIISGMRARPGGMR